MNENGIKAADKIIELASTREAHFPEMMNFSMGALLVWDLEDIRYAAESLKNAGLIEISKKDREDAYKLTGKGVEFKQLGESYRIYLEREAEAEAKRIAKEKRDEYHKTLQIQDLETKLEVMNVEQRDFWAEQKMRNKQLTLIAIIGALFSLVAMLKSFGFF